MIEHLIGTTHLVLLTAGEGPKDIGDMIHIKFISRSKLMNSILNTPPDVFIFLGLKEVHHLRESCKAFGIKMLGYVNEVILVV